MNATSPQEVFGTVPPRYPLGFLGHGPEGLHKLTKFLDLDRGEVSKVGGVPQNRVRYDDQMPKELHDRLEEIATVCEQVADYFKGDAEKTALWFRLQNPLFGNLSPRDMIRFGRYQRVLKIVRNAFEGNTS